MLRLLRLLLLVACASLMTLPAAAETTPAEREIFADEIPPRGCPNCLNTTVTSTSSTTATTAPGSTATTPTTDVGVLPEVTEQVPPGAGGDIGTGASPRALSRTGTDAGAQVLLAVGLIGSGIAVSVAARRRRRSIFA